MKPRFFRPTGLLLACLLTSACAMLDRPALDDPQIPTGPGETPPASDMLAGEGAANPAAAEDEAPAEAAEPHPGLSPQTMYSLLVAEMAGYQNRLDIALANYASQARITKDPGIAERATRIAQYLKDHRTALDTALIWADGQPDNLEAQEVASRLLIESGNLEAALHYMERALELDGNTNFDFLALSAQQMSTDQQTEVLAAFSTMLERHPDNVQLLFGHAVLLRQADRLDDALREAGRLPLLAPDYVQGYLLEARLLHEKGDREAALERLHAATLRFPDDVRVRHQYARVLVENDRLQQAREQFAHLLRNDPTSSDLRYSLALIDYELEDFDAAARQFRNLIDSGEHLAESWYYLGTIAEKQGDTEAAVQAYENVPAEGGSLASRARIAQIIAERDGITAMRNYLARLGEDMPDMSDRLQLLEIELLMNLDQAAAALDAANGALRQRPDDHELLYARAMAYAELDQVEELEQDLRKILREEPDNAAALNALGYTLADRTDRYDEALALISQALRLKPDDPAIRDSMGWVQYRLGNHDEALRLLREAFEAFPDHEVAAHLGEVLWVTGNHPEARRIWRESLERRPDSKLLRAVMQRFDVQID